MKDRLCFSRPIVCMKLKFSPTGESKDRCRWIVEISMTIYNSIRRIGIMVRGKLRCLGSPLELKRRFGSGYKISLGLRKDVAVDQKTIQENIVQLMRKSMTLKSGMMIAVLQRFDY
jgi:hypothetical protein